MEDNSISLQPRSKTNDILLMLVIIFALVAVLSAIGGQENAVHYAKAAAALYAVLHLLSGKYLPAVILSVVAIV